MVLRCLDPILSLFFKWKCREGAWTPLVFSMSETTNSYTSLRWRTNSDDVRHEVSIASQILAAQVLCKNRGAFKGFTNTCLLSHKVIYGLCNSLELDARYCNFIDGMSRSIGGVRNFEMTCTFSDATARFTNSPLYFVREICLNMNWQVSRFDARLTNKTKKSTYCKQAGGVADLLKLVDFRVAVTLANRNHESLAVGKR